MPDRKNEPWQAWLDREYPHHVELPAEDAEKLQKRILVACAAISTASRTRAVSRDGRKFVVYRFASATDARGFAGLFGGKVLTRHRAKRSGGRKTKE